MVPFIPNKDTIGPTHLEGVVMNWLVKSLVLIMGIILLSACSSKLVADVNDAIPDGLKSRGLGLRSTFDSQEKGEVYTTKAPHNQVFLFAFDNATLQPKYRKALNAQGRYLIRHSGARVMIAGHTDNRGSREYNIALGERRAKTVFNFLRIAGVPKRQMRVVSYGQERPVSFGHDEESYRLNRRVELTYEAIR